MFTQKLGLKGRIAFAGVACAVVVGLTGCGSDDGGSGAGVTADRVSYSTLEDLAEASQFAAVGEVTGARDATTEPLPPDSDGEGEETGSALPVTQYTIDITDPLGSHKAVGDQIRVNMIKNTLDSYTTTLAEAQELFS